MVSEPIRTANRPRLTAPSSAGASSLRFAAGIPSYEVARLAGTSVTQIEATYAHLFDEHLERSQSALEAFDASISDTYGRESGARD